MTTIPQQLTFGLKRMSGFSKNVLKVLPLNSSSFSAGGQMQIRFPTNSVIDLCSLSLIFQATPQNGVLPVIADNLVQRLEILLNGQSIFGSTLQEYSVLAQMLFDAHVGYDKYQEKKMYGVSQAITAQPAVAGAPQWMTLDSFFGFLGGGYQRYIDTSTLGALELRLQWAPSTVIAPTSAGQTAQSQTFSVSNVELLMETLDWQDGWFQKSLAAALSSGSILVPYKNYASFNFASSGTGGTVNTSFAAESIDRVYAFLRPNDFDAYNPTSTIDWANTANSHYFQRMGDGATHQLRINNYLIPNFPCNTQEAYTVLKNTLNQCGNNLSAVNQFTSSTQYSQGKFIFGVGLCFSDDTPLSKIASGLSTVGSQIPIAYTWSGGALSGGITSYRPCVVLECTSYLEVFANQVVQVHT